MVRPMRSPGKLTSRIVGRFRRAGARVHDALGGRAEAADKYWTNPGRPDWKQNSHWRDAPVVGWSDVWAGIGASHLAMYQRFARAYDLPAPRRTMEWGVGGGANAIHFAPMSEEFVAVDVARDSLDETARQVKKQCPTKVTPLLVSIDDQARGVTSFDGMIDLFLCFYVLELVPTEAHAHEIVRIAFRTLRPGGTAIIQAKYKRSIPGFRPWGSFLSNLANSYVVAIDEFWEFLSSVGFEARQIELVPRNELDRNYAYFFVTKPGR